MSAHVDINSVKSVKFWVQKVLPLVYDDSLSYMELLNRVVFKINEMTDIINGLPDAINKAIDDELQAVLESYKESLKTEVLGYVVDNADSVAEGISADTLRKISFEAGVGSVDVLQWVVATKPPYDSGLEGIVEKVETELEDGGKNVEIPDNAEKLQAIIDWVSEKNKDGIKYIIYVPAGKYSIGKVVLKDNVRIVGAGMGNTVFTRNDSSNDPNVVESWTYWITNYTTSEDYHTTQYRNIRLYDLTLDALETVVYVGLDKTFANNCILYFGGYDFKCKGVEFKNALAGLGVRMAIEFDFDNYCYIEHCKFTNICHCFEIAESVTMKNCEGDLYAFYNYVKEHIEDAGAIEVRQPYIVNDTVNVLNCWFNFRTNYEENGEHDFNALSGTGVIDCVVIRAFDKLYTGDSKSVDIYNPTTGTRLIRGGSVNMTAGGNVDVNVTGTTTIGSTGNVNIHNSGDTGVTADGKVEFTSGSEVDVVVGGDMNVTADNIGLDGVLGYDEQESVSDVQTGDKAKTLVGKLVKGLSDFIVHKGTLATNDILGHVRLTNDTNLDATSTDGFAVSGRQLNPTINGTLASNLQSSNRGGVRTDIRNVTIDANTITSPQVRNIGFGTTAVNFPVASGTGTLFVIGFQTDGVEQILIVKGGAVYRRDYINNQWSEWVLISNYNLNNTNGIYSQNINELVLNSGISATSINCWSYNKNGTYILKLEGLLSVTANTAYTFNLPTNFPSFEVTEDITIVTLGQSARYCEVKIETNGKVTLTFTAVDSVPMSFNSNIVYF